MYSFSHIVRVNFIVTLNLFSAAHCVLLKGQRTPTRDIIVRVGVYDPEDWGDDIAVTRSLLSVHVYESYNDKTLSSTYYVGSNFSYRDDD